MLQASQVKGYSPNRVIWGMHRNAQVPLSYTHHMRICFHLDRWSNWEAHRVSLRNCLLASLSGMARRFDCLLFGGALISLNHKCQMSIFIDCDSSRHKHYPLCHRLTQSIVAETHVKYNAENNIWQHQTWHRKASKNTWQNKAWHE